MEERQSLPEIKRRLRRLAVVWAAALALFALIGFVVLPPLVRHVAESQITEHLGRRASIGHVRINPFSLSLTVEDLEIYEADGTTPFLGFARLHVNAQLASIYRRGPVVEEVRLEGPHLRVVRTRATKDGFADLDAYNFSDILRKLEAAGAPAKAPPPPPAAPTRAEPPPRFSVHNISISDGRVTFEDQPTGSRHELSQLSVGVPFVSTLPVDIDTFVQPGFAVNLDGTPFSVHGKTKPFKDSLETTLELRLESLDLTRYQPYVPSPVRARLDSGRLTVALDVSFVRKADAVPVIRLAGRVGLAKVALRSAGAPGLADAPLLALERLEAHIADADLAALRFHLDRVVLSGLDVHARRLADGALDWQRLVPAAPPAAKPSPSAGAAPRFVLDELRLEKIDVHLRDETVRPAFVETLRDLTVSARHLSNAPGAEAQVTASLRAEPGGTLTESGTLVLAPFAATGTVKLEGLEPGRFAPYYRDQIAFDVTRGKVEVSTGYRVVSRGRSTAVTLSGAGLELDDVALQQRTGGAPFFELGRLAVTGTGVDLDGRTADVGQVTVRDLRVKASRAANGIVDLTTLAGPAAASSGAPPATTAPATTAPPASGPPAPAAGEGGPPPAPWTVNVAGVDLENGSARFVDHAVKPDATLAIDRLAVHARGLSTKPGTRPTLDVRFGLNRVGAVQVTGTAGADPLAADLRLDLRRVAILPFQPYFKDRVTLLVTDGEISLKGRARVEPPVAPAKRGEAPAPRISFAGDLDIANLGTLDGRKNERLLGWKSFHAGGIEARGEPPSLAIRELALTDFIARLIIFPDAHFNLEDIVVKAPAATATATSPSRKDAAKEATKVVGRPTPGPSSAPAPRITIAQVTLQGGQVSFTDRLIQPNYSAELTELGGRITGLSSAVDTTAEVALRGAVDHSGRLSIDGRMNPLARQLFLDLKVSLQDFELPPTSPYAARYVGYGIDKGKLALGLEYHVANGKLSAENKVVLDQLTFGDAVKSADAIHLPVKLAIALLKDRHGVIDIDLPVAGSLDDPEFKLARLILKTLGNLVVKAVTAPFSLIAKAFGGGDEASYLEFASGNHDLDARGLAKLQGVGKALQERPGLSFEIEGLADPKTDLGGLRQHLYDRKLRGQKQRLIVEAGNAAPQADRIEIDPAERPQLIAAVYRAETFPKPRNPDGAEKTLSPAEMEKLILAAQRVEPDDLRQLALRRATAVKEALAKAAPEAAPRLFLINPRTATPGNRVELKLKQD